MKRILLFIGIITVINVTAQNNCLTFNGTTNYAEVPDGAALDLSTGVTLEAWIYPTSWTTEVWRGSIINKEGATGDGYMIRCGAGGTLSFNLGIGGFWQELLTSAGALTLNTWQHVAAVYNGSNMYLYINGIQVANRAQTGSISVNAMPLRIGAWAQNADRFFPGKIDEVRVWNTGLNSGIIASWYNKTISSCHPNYANLVGYYEMDDAVPATTLQQTVGANGSVSGASYGLANNASFLGTVIGYQSTTASQPNTGTVNTGATNVEIIKIEVEVYSSMNATEFRIRTNGTTNVSDILNAKLWFTGTNSSFTTTTQFGSTIAVPPVAGTDMVFSGTQALSCGKNYFWLTYDISAGATLGNFVDAVYQSSIVNAVTRTPVTTTPAGNRQIASSCNHTIRLTDTFGDGWNGGTVTLQVNGVDVLTGLGTTFTGGTGPVDFTFSASSGANITVIETNGGFYPTEMRVEILDGGGISLGAPFDPNTTGTSFIGNCPASMTFSSATVVQASTANVVQGDLNQQILSLQIVTSGTTSPLSLSQIQLQLAGTSPTTDISKIHVYYTGTTNTFSAIGPFDGAGTNVAGGTININGSQVLATGTNYFWVAFDISGSAAIGNVVDALMLASPTNTITVGGLARTVTANNPAGTRTIVGCTPPSITSQPVNQSVNAGAGTAVFSVTATNGLSYQWQESTNGGTSWNNVSNGGVYSGATTSSLTITNPAIGMNGYKYRVIIGTCLPVATSNGNATLTVLIAYCISNATSTGDEEIFNVTIGSINNTSDCNTLAGGPGSLQNMYSNYSTTVTPANLTVGNSYPFSVQIGTCGGNYGNAIKIFIDYNQDGDFLDTGEEAYVSPSTTSGPHTETGNIVIPASAIGGNTRMRVVNSETAPGSITSCGTYSWGETEDYTVNIVTLPMSYVSSTVLQNNTYNVPQGLTNQEVICVKVVTDGGLSPFAATSFNIKMTGTTNIADVSNIKMYYTGSVSTFSAINLFGTVSPATGSLTVNGTQTLSTGNNYFWIAYDISPTAIINNYIDAECNSVTMNGGIGTKVPTIQNPSGRRKIIALAPCTHTIRLYDFDFATNSTGWGTDNVDVLVNGVPVLIDKTLTTANGVAYTFQASEGQTISTVYSGTSSQSMYVITGGQGDFIMEDGVENTVPTGKTALASCVFVPKFTINGHGYYNGESIAKTNANGNCITLTDEIQGTYATAWHNTKVDLSTSFQIKFDLNFGDRTGFGSSGGADGIAFVFQDRCINAGISGSGIGFGGITPSVAIEFDTYQNGVPNNDPWQDHVAIFKNGNNTHGSADDLLGTTYNYPSSGTLPTGSYKSYTVNWNSVTKTLTVLDGVTTILSYSGDIVTNIFGGVSDVYWGFSAATGESTNHQRVKVTGYPSATASSALTDVSITSGSSIQAFAAQGGATYVWSPGTGVSNTSIYNPVFSPTVTTTYTVTITDDCGNTMTDDFTITVFGSLPVEMIDFAVICSISSVDIKWRTASESNSNNFVIERSAADFDFKEIGMVKAAGNSNHLIDYTFVDIEPVKNKINYYRLKQVDLDGSFVYSDVLASDCEENHQLEVNIYSGSEKNETNIDFSLETKEDFILEIFDFSSRLIIRKTIPAGTKSYSLVNSNITYGAYIFCLSNKSDRFVKKLLK